MGLGVPFLTRFVLCSVDSRAGVKPDQETYGRLIELVCGSASLDEVRSGIVVGVESGQCVASLARVH